MRARYPVTTEGEMEYVTEVISFEKIALSVSQQSKSGQVIAG